MKMLSNEGTKEIGGDRMKAQRKKQKPKGGGWVLKANKLGLRKLSEAYAYLKSPVLVVTCF